MTEKNSILPSLRNQDWKTVKVENEQNKRLINEYPNVQHHRIKRTNLHRSEISQWKNQGSPKNTNRKFDLVWFYCISTIVCYLMPNPFLYI